MILKERRNSIIYSSVFVVIYELNLVQSIFLNELKMRYILIYFNLSDE